MAQDNVQITTKPNDKNQDSGQFESGVKMQIKPMGASGTEVFAGYFTEEYLQKLRGRAGAKIYDEMRRSEAQIAMLMNAIMNPIKAGSWELEEASDVEGADLHKELVEFCLKEMIDWETFIHEALTFLIYGFSMFEVVHNVVFEHEKFGTFNGLKALAFRSQKTIHRWNVDRSTGSLASVEQYTFGDIQPQGEGTLSKMDANYLLVFSLQKEGDNYEGISALRPMYGPYFRKNLYLKIVAIGIEKSAIGVPIGTIPKGKTTAEELANFKEMLSNFTAHESAYLLKPEGWLVEVVQNTFDPSKVKEMLVFENTEMVNSLVANFLALGTNGGGGAFALASDLSDFFLSGIQNYANIITGIINRSLIPDLIKLNYGPQKAYPKLKSAGISDKAGKELAEVIGLMLDKKAIKPDMKLDEFIRKIYALPKADPETSWEGGSAAQPMGAPLPTVPAPAGAMLSETQRIKLAETYKQQWNSNKRDVKLEMQAGLYNILENYKKQVKTKWNGASPAARVKIGLQLEPKGVTEYRNILREVLASVANDALIAARKQTPKAKNVKLSETIQLAAPKGGYFEALPNNIKNIVKSQADLISMTQANDIGKVVAFQFTSSSAAEDVDQIIKDIDDAVLPTIEGSTGKGLSLDAAAGNAVASVFNQAQLEWFFEPEVLQTLESFTFYNEDPISEICQELDGTTWASNDPDLDKYSPPLHHNCKSRLVPNEKGADNNPEIQRGGTPITQKALDSITLCEGHFGLEFQLVERESNPT
jgi:hypothetical protein